MGKVIVMADSIAGIPPDLAKEYAIRVVPAANILFAGKTYIDGETITPAEAYQFIRKDPDKFMTSAITPGYLLGVYRELAKKTDTIFFPTISLALSAVSQTAAVAVELFKQESPKTTIRIWDSRTVAAGEGLVVLAAARAAAKGMSLDKVAAVAEKARQKTGSVMLLDTLRYIYRAGRMSKLSARMLSWLNIKPVNIVTPEGTIELVRRSQKRATGMRQMLEVIKKEAGTDALHFMIMHADAPDMAHQFHDQLKEKFKVLSMVISDYSPVMGYGSGPGCLSVGFHPEIDLSQA